MNRVMKIFAVVALSGGAASADTAPRVLKTARPACGNVMGGKSKGARRSCEPAAKPEVKLAVVKVRTLRNGRPAAGNVQKKAGGEADEAMTLAAARP